MCHVGCSVDLLSTGQGFQKVVTACGGLTPAGN